MKVLHLNTHDVLGGAARSAYRLHTGLRRIGVGSRMLVRTKHSDDPTVTAIDTEGHQAKIHDAVEAFYVRPRLPEGGGSFSFSPVTPSLADHPLVKEADIIHLHWTAQFLSPESIRALAELGKPLFWTFHDLWAVTGGCHYSGACGNYQSICRDCPAIAQNVSSRVQLEHQRKLEGLRALRVRLIAPSCWIRDAARRSAVAGEWEAAVVPYGIDTGIFCPQSRAEAREAFGISTDRICLLFGCHSILERRKGFAEMREALRLSGVDAELLVFGSDAESLPEMPIPVHPLGRLTTDESVARAFAAADVYLCPTLEDNLPNTVMESLCCGVPVIGFATGGVPEMVEHGVSGLLAPSGGVPALAEMISKFAGDAALRDRLRQGASELRPERFALETQARSMLDHYRETTGEAGADYAGSPVWQQADWRVAPSFATTVAESCARALNAAEQTLAGERHAKMGNSHTMKQQARELKEAERENRKLRQKLEDLTLHPWRAFRAWIKSGKAK